MLVTDGIRRQRLELGLPREVTLRHFGTPKVSDGACGSDNSRAVAIDDSQAAGFPSVPGACGPAGRNLVRRSRPHQFHRVLALCRGCGCGLRAGTRRPRSGSDAGADATRRPTGGAALPADGRPHLPALGGGRHPATPSRRFWRAWHSPPALTASSGTPATRRLSSPRSGYGAAATSRDFN